MKKVLASQAAASKEMKKRGNRSAVYIEQSEGTTKLRHKRAATARSDRLWNYGVIPYDIEANFTGVFSDMLTCFGLISCNGYSSRFFTLQCTFDIQLLKLKLSWKFIFQICFCCVKIHSIMNYYPFKLMLSIIICDVCISHTIVLV